MIPQTPTHLVVGGGGKRKKKKRRAVNYLEGLGAPAAGVVLHGPHRRWGLGRGGHRVGEGKSSAGERRAEGIDAGAVEGGWLCCLLRPRFLAVSRLVLGSGDSWFDAWGPRRQRERGARCGRVGNVWGTGRDVSGAVAACGFDAVHAVCVKTIENKHRRRMRHGRRAL